MKMLITGGAGFIGSNFIFYMRKMHPDYDLVCVDKLTYAGNLETLASVMDDPKFRFIRADIADRSEIYRIFEAEKPDTVVNFAAESHVDRSIENPAVFLETNVMGTQVLLDASRKYGVKRYHQVSTDEVYGDLPLDRPDLFFTEETPLHTSSPYSASKASADLLCNAYQRTYGMPITISRCSNNYGPYQFPEKLIPLVINNILEGKKLPVYGRGENVRDWLYVDDHAKAIDTVLRRGKTGEIYNIGGFNEEQNISIVKAIIDIIRRIMEEEPEYRHLLHQPVEDINYDLISYVTDRPGHDMRYAIDPTRIATELGWYPETTFTEGIEKTVRWNLDNHEWLRSVTSGDYLRYYDEMYGNR